MNKTQIMDSLNSLHKRVTANEEKMFRLAQEVRKWQDAVTGAGSHMTQGYMSPDGTRLIVQTPRGPVEYVPATKGRRAAGVRKTTTKRR